MILQGDEWALRQMNQRIRFKRGALIFRVRCMNPVNIECGNLLASGNNVCACVCACACACVCEQVQKFASTLVNITPCSISASLTVSAQRYSLIPVT